VKHRSAAALLIESGAVRINRQRVTKVAQAVKSGDVVTLVVEDDVKVLEVTGEAARRGSAAVAQQLYHLIDDKTINSLTN
jgi:ribosome-associated heat shock protein Hsp15